MAQFTKQAPFPYQDLTLGFSVFFTKDATVYRPCWKQSDGTVWETVDECETPEQAEKMALALIRFYASLYGVSVPWSHKRS